MPVRALSRPRRMAGRQIVTSALTAGGSGAEHPDANPLPSGLETTINEFFESESKSCPQPDRYIGDFRRHLLWSYKHLAYKDAVHVATAIQIPNITVSQQLRFRHVETGRKLAILPLRICNPDAVPAAVGGGR